MVKPRKRQVFVEGGGDHNPRLESECRKAFRKLYGKAGVSHPPQTVVCGSRKNAYDQFYHAMQWGKAVDWLLVDAEEHVSPDRTFDPWAHVKARQGDKWNRPSGATDNQLHLMNVVMETWLLADHEALRKVFPNGLDEARLLPEGASLETIDKDAIYQSLKTATRKTQAGPYDKGKLSFRVLAEVSPSKLRLLPWANRFLDEFAADRAKR